MASADRVARYRAMVKDLTELIDLAGGADFPQREQETLPRVHEHFFAAVADRQRPQN